MGKIDADKAKAEIKDGPLTVTAPIAEEDKGPEGQMDYLGANDLTSRRMLEGILAMEKEHADDLVSLWKDRFPSNKGGSVTIK
jgi:hypothetical protein